MKKLIPVAALSGLLFVIGFISISVRNTNNAFAAAPCKSCAKAADSGKKQSSSKKICSAITGILKNEIGKTKNKTKLDILKGGLDYANDVCDSGGSPDLAKITKGLPEKDKARISQKTNAALFDGVADRPDKDFGPSTSKTAATLTGKGGQVTDLKSAEPSIPKLNATSEFSLSGTKLTGGTSAPPTTKQSATLLASATQLNTSTATASSLPAKSPSDTTASATTVSAQKALAASDPIIPMVRECKCYYGGLFLEVGEGGIPGSVCEAWKTKNCCPQNQTMAATGCSASCKAGTGFWGFYADWRHDRAGETSNCGSECFHPGKKCCLASKAVGEQCGAVCYDPKTDCCVDGKKQETGSVACKCQRIEKRIEGVEGIIATYNQGKKPKDGVSYAYTTCADDETGNLVGTPVYLPPFYDLDPELQDAVKKHEEIHKQQCETDGWWKWWWRNNFDKPLIEIPAYQREKIILEKTFREKCGR